MAEEEKKKRGRPKKIVTPPPEPLAEEQKTLLMVDKASTKPVTMEEVQINLNNLYKRMFSRVGASGYGFIYGNGFNGYNPFLQNQRLKEINYQPVDYSKEDIIDFLKTPQSSEEALRGAGWNLSSTNYLYYLITRLAADVPMYKYYKDPPLLKASEYKSKEFQAEDKFTDEWMREFNPQSTLKDVALEVKREGKASYLLRNGITTNSRGEKKVNFCTFQKLPSKYVKLTAIGSYGYIASFDMIVFMNPAFNVDQYPDFIRKIWEEMIENKVVQIDHYTQQRTVDVDALVRFTYEDDEGNTVKGLFEQTDKRYFYWVQLPQEICYTFASDNSHPWAVPDTAGLFLGLKELADYNSLAGLVASTPLTMILTGEIETVNDPNAGRDQTIMNPETIAAFQNQFNGQTSTSVESFFAPVKNMKLQSVNTSLSGLDIASNALKNFISSAGEGGVIVSNDKPSVAQVKGAQLVEEAKHDYVTRQFEKVLNMIVNKLLGCKYEWKYHLWGGIFTFENDLKRTKELFMSGASFLLPRVASAYDMTMRDVKAVGLYTDSLEVYSEFKTITQEQQNRTNEAENAGVTKKVGRPEISDEDIESDSTAASKDRGDDTADMRDYIAESVDNHKCIICGADTEDGQVLCEECLEKYGAEVEE